MSNYFDNNARIQRSPLGNSTHFEEESGFLTPYFVYGSDVSECDVQSSGRALVGTCYTVPELTQYWVIVYMSLMTMLGDTMEAQNNSERVLAIFTTLLGACLTAIMFGQMAQILQGELREARRRPQLYYELCFVLTTFVFLNTQASIVTAFGTTS